MSLQPVVVGFPVASVTHRGFTWIHGDALGHPTTPESHAAVKGTLTPHFKQPLTQLQAARSLNDAKEKTDMHKHVQAGF